MLPGFDQTHEFAQGDIVMEIGGSVRYLIREKEKWGYIIVALDGTGLGAMKGSKTFIEGTCVKVGRWDSTRKCEVADEEDA